MYFTYGSVCISMLLSAFVPLSPSLLTFQQTGIYQCQLFKTFSVSQPSCTFIQPVNYENLPRKKLYDFFKWLSSFSSVQLLSHVWLCDPMPGLPVNHQLPEFTQTHVHWVSDAIEPSHPIVPFYSCLQLFPASGSFQIVSSLKELKKHSSFFLNLEWLFYLTHNTIQKKKSVL